MDYLTERKNDIVLTSEIETELVQIESMLKFLKERKSMIEKKILEEMANRHILKVTTPSVTINYIAPTTRESFDSKKFRTENPELYDEYVRISPVKESIRIKVKESIKVDTE